MTLCAQTTLHELVTTDVASLPVLLLYRCVSCHPGCNFLQGKAVSEELGSLLAEFRTSSPQTCVVTSGAG
jgi:hypothetical protein